MSIVVKKDFSSFESALIGGDLSKLSQEQRLSYYNNVCSSLGLNPLTQPFSYQDFQGKLSLYAKRDATDQLRSLRGVSIKITSRELIGDTYIVTAQARLADGREDESTGAVDIKNLSGERLANAYMKAETKAKRRVTLSICGLGMLDETEVEDLDAPQTKTLSLESTDAELTEALVGKFRKLGVTANQIASKFSLPSVEELDANHIKELTEIGRSLVLKKSKVVDHFKLPNMAPGA